MKKKSSIPAPSERGALLTTLRRLKMARSSKDYVRGNTVKFYEWLQSKSGLAVPQGPAIWICGDCHSGNLGPVADAKGRIDIEIRDLDQTVIGNPAHDLIRLGMSLASSARGSDLPGITTARMLEEMMEGYVAAFCQKKKKIPGDKMPESIRIVMKAAVRRTWKHLAQEHIEGTDPSIPLGKRFWPLSSKEKREVKKLFSQEDVRNLVTALKSRDDDAPVKVLDAAYWVKGCSSLGHLRYAVLVKVGNGKNADFCLIDIKEALHAAAPVYAGADMPKENAERIVTGAQNLSPGLGGRMLAAKFNSHAVFLRELLPQDLKFDIEQLTQDEAVKVARFLANAVGKAHARQMDKPTRLKWGKLLKHNNSKTLNAPSWLWSSVVELVVSHEKAYLEHCRAYAFATS